MPFIWDKSDLKAVLLLLISIVTFSCTITDTSELEQTFSPRYKFKTITSQSYYHRSGFCSDNVTINSDSTYTWESGCEGSSHPSIGRWSIKKDSIILRDEAPNPDLISFDLKLSTYSNNKYTTFIILDKKCNPIEGFAIIPFNDTVSSRIGYYESQFKTDSLGILKVRKNKTDSLDFPKLVPFTNRHFRISNNNLPDTVKIIIAVNKSAFRYDDLSYQYSKRESRFKWINNKIVLPL